MSNDPYRTAAEAPSVEQPWTADPTPAEIEQYDRLVFEYIRLNKEHVQARKTETQHAQRARIAAEQAYAAIQQRRRLMGRW